MVYEYFECMCGCEDHAFRVARFDKESGMQDFAEVYLSMHLRPKNFFKRIKIAIKYILGFQSKYGCFDEIILEKPNVKNLISFLEKGL